MCINQFLTKKELASLLGCSESTISRRYKAGDDLFSSAIRFGRLIRWNRALFQNLGLNDQAPIVPKGGDDE